MNNIEQGPGGRLSQARELLRLTQADVARQLNLKLVYIQSIEKDIYDIFPAIVFVRGYLRSYANLVKVPANEIIQMFNHLGLEEKVSTVSRQVLSKKTDGYDHSTRWVSYGIALLLLILLFIWWRSESKMTISHINEIKPTVVAPLPKELDALQKEPAVVPKAPLASTSLPMAPSIEKDEQ